jgi:SAM-dependent methyltransferase
MKHLLFKLKSYFRTFMYSKLERRHALVGPAKQWKMKRDFQIKFLRERGLHHDDYLLDIGCGTLRGGIPIIKFLDEGHYFGIDVREEVLNVARVELKEAGLARKNPMLIPSSTINGLAINQMFDFIWAFSVLIHMTDEILNDTLYFVSVHLAEEGVFYTNVNIGEREQGNWQGFPVVWRSLEFYSQACALYGLIVSDLGPLIDLGHISNIESQDNQRMLEIRRKPI